jgi:hypothetical protein
VAHNPGIRQQGIRTSHFGLLTRVGRAYFYGMKAAALGHVGQEDLKYLKSSAGKAVDSDVLPGRPMMRMSLTANE